MPENVKVYVEVRPVQRYVAGDIPQFDVRPIGKQQGDLHGIFVQFEWRFDRVISVVVTSQTQADLLLNASLLKK